MIDIPSLQKNFEQRFSARARVFSAPGRVNLIGEHTDYNDGFVFPMAIEPDVRIVCRGRDDARECPQLQATLGKSTSNRVSVFDPGACCTGCERVE